MSFWHLDPLSAAPALLMQDGSVLSYAQLAQLCDKLQADLPARDGRSLGFIPIPSTVEALALYLACLRSRACVPLLLPADLDRRLLDGLVSRYRPDWIACWQHEHDIDGYTVHDTASVVPIAVRSAVQPGRAPIHADLALLLTTSGSTGSPKLVRLSYEAIGANAAAIATYLGLGATDRAITALPLSYSYGLSIVHSHLHAGASLLVGSGDVMTRGFWENMERFDITSISGVPSTYEMLRRVGLEKRPLPRLRYLTQAGGHLRQDLAVHFEQLCRTRGWQFFIMYGQTEAAPRMSYVPPAMIGSKIGTVGIAVPGGSFEVDPTNHELLYRGPNVMMGYAERHEDLALGDQCGGLLRTGDTAEIDADGYVRITGRLKRFIKLSGMRISLDSVEKRLAEGLEEPVACTGQDGLLEIWGQTGRVDADRIGQLLRELLNINPAFIRVNEIAELPINANGKFDYTKLA